MTPAPPRRPRRWSWSCTAVAVQVAGVLALAAMVAMPEGHRLVWVLPLTRSKESLILAGGPVPSDRFHVLGDVRAAGVPASRLYRTERERRSGAIASRQVTSKTLDQLRYHYRDAGLHVLLDGFWEWLTQ